MFPFLPSPGNDDVSVNAEEKGRFLPYEERDDGGIEHSTAQSALDRDSSSWIGPAESAVRYEERTLYRKLEDNPYTGKPRPDFDQAWHDLLDPFTTKISAEELERWGEKSIGLEDGSGYIVEMSVFHELHCIKRLRQHMYLEHYFPNLTDEQQELEDIHMDHCLEYLREATMCRADVSLAHFYWSEDGLPATPAKSRHECVDWDRLFTWAKSRKMDVSDQSVLVGAPPHR